MGLFLLKQDFYCKETKMGVDYEGVGGIGVYLDDEKLDKLFATEAFSAEEWEGLGPDECLLRLDLPGWATVGNAYYGETEIVFLIDGNNIVEVVGNEATFREKFAKYGIDLALNDLVVISELYVY